MKKCQIKHPIKVLLTLQSERDVFLKQGTTIDLDKVTRPILDLLRFSWQDNPHSISGDIIYLFNRELPRKLSETEKDTPGKA